MNPLAATLLLVTIAPGLGCDGAPRGSLLPEKVAEDGWLSEPAAAKRVLKKGSDPLIYATTGGLTPFSTPSKPERPVFLAGGLSDEQFLALSAAIAASTPSGILLIDAPES